MKAFNPLGRIAIILLIALVFQTNIVQAQDNSVAIGSPTTKANAVLWLNGNGSQGLLLPSVASVNDIGAPDAGMIVYQTSDNKVYYRNAASWVVIGSGGTGGTDQSLTYNASTGVLTISGSNSTVTLSVSGDLTGNLNNVQLAAGAVGITELGNMGASTDQYLVFNGTAWEARNIPSGTFSGVTTDATITGDGLNTPLSVANVDDADASPTNEIQDISFDAGTNTLSLTEPGQPNQTVDLSSLAGGASLTAGTGIDITGGVISNTGDSDADVTNELQNLSLTGNTLNISNGTGVDLTHIIPVGSTDDQNLVLTGDV